MDDEPELYLFRPPDPGEQWRAEQEGRHREARQRVLDQLVGVLAVADALTEEPQARAEAVADGLFVHRYPDSSEPCGCGCHPQLPTSGLHDFGATCPCRLTAEQRRASWDAWTAERDAFWGSPEGRAITAQRRADEVELDAWVAAEPGVTISGHGGFVPEQWRGTVDGHSFSFRERHDHWRIEIDLVPSGRTVEVWRGGEPGDEDTTAVTELDEGEVLAEGDTSAEGYGSTPVERARFIVDTIRTGLQRRTCTAHTVARTDLERALPCAVRYCPACGERLPDRPPDQDR